MNKQWWHQSAYTNEVLAEAVLDKTNKSRKLTDVGGATLYYHDDEIDANSICVVPGKRRQSMQVTLIVNTTTITYRHYDDPLPVSGDSKECISGAHLQLHTH